MHNYACMPVWMALSEEATEPGREWARLLQRRTARGKGGEVTISFLRVDEVAAMALARDVHKRVS